MADPRPMPTGATGYRPAAGGGRRLRLDRAICTPAEEDRLDTDALVRALLATPSDGNLIVGLYRPWGRGKTSARYLLETALNETEHQQTTTSRLGPQARMIRFKPWYYTGVESLLTEFFATLAEGIGGDHSLQGSVAASLAG